MKTKSIAIIGGGNMGEAFVKGLIDQQLFTPDSIFVCEADAARARYLKGKYKVTIGHLDFVLAEASAVILAIKPQDMENALSLIKSYDKLFISIAAGLSTKFFEKHLGGRARVVRAMPNMPALIGEGMTAICKGRFAASKDMREAGRLLGAVGKVLEIDEKYMDAITAVSGSGPAYVFLFVEHWMAAARSLGLSEKQAKDLVDETLAGSAHLLRQSEFSAGELRVKVTSKGGTTQAAMDVFFKGNLAKLMKDALTAAKRRARELAR